MKKQFFTGTFATAALLSSIALGASPAEAFTLTFENIPSRNAAGDAIVDQFSVDVTDNGSGGALFKVINASGGVTSTITEIAWNNPNGLFTGISISDEPLGVDFNVQSGGPIVIPQANNIIPTFTEAFGVERRNRGGVANGIDPGEYLTVLLTLAGGKTFADVEAASGLLIGGLSNSNPLRLAIHVQRIEGENGGSDSFVSVPAPALLPGLIGLGVAAFRKRKGEVGNEEVVES